MDDQIKNEQVDENLSDVKSDELLLDAVSSDKDTDIVEEQVHKSETIGLSNKISSSQVKKYFLYILIGGLIVSAVISIVAVLVGEFNDFILKSLFTTLSIVVHSLIALAFVSVNEKNHSGANEIIVNTLFGITIASFATSIFALWEVITGPIIWDLYLMYIYSLIAALLCRALLQANRIDKVTRKLADASIIVTIFLFFLLLPSVFANILSSLPDIYYRGIAATAILLGTMSVLTAILHRLFESKHPELRVKKSPSSALKIIVIIAILLFVVYPIVSMIISSLRYNY